MSEMERLSMVPPWDRGPDAGRTIRETLADGGSEPSERLLAAELAGDPGMMDDAMAGALLGIVRSPEEPEKLRGAAAIALGPILEDLDIGFHDDDPEEAPVSAETETEIRRTLRAVYLDGEAPKYVRRRVLEASVRAPAEWHAGAVRSAYHEGDDEWRLTAVFCMAWIPGFDGEIVEALESGDPKLRYEAVRAAGHRGTEGAWPHLRAILLRPEYVDRSLLLAAIGAVPGIDPPDADEVLGSLLEVDDEEITDAAFDAMAMCGLLPDAELVDEEDDGELDDGPPPEPRGNGAGGGNRRGR